MNDFEKGLIALTQNAVNGIGTINVPVRTEAGVLTLGIDPKINLSKLDFNSFNINQLDISDTHIQIGFKGPLPNNFAFDFKIDSQIGSWTKSGDSTKISLDLANTTIDSNVNISMSFADNVVNLASPSGTNDFSATFSLKAKL